MSKSSAKALITNVFKTNGTGAITGATSQSALTGAIDVIYDDKIDVIASPTTGNLIQQTSTGGIENAGISASAVSTHLASTENPHSVTKAQLGLGNVDNTSDEDKPISTATQTALDEKADIDGIYPLLQSGSATNIAGADAVDAEIIYRTSGGTADIGSGTAKIDKIEGNSYAWNQLVQISETSKTTTVNGITFTDNRDGSYTLNGTATAEAPLVVRNEAYIANHKQLLLGSAANGSLSTYFIVDAWTSSRDTGNGIIFNSNANSDIRIIVESGVTVSNLIFRPQLYDLTLIFGSGNEPATLSALKATPIGAYITSGYHAYDGGSLLSCKATGIKTTGFNQWDEQWELGVFNTETGESIASTTQIRCKNNIKVLADTNYYIAIPSLLGVGGHGAWLMFLDEDANPISGYTVSGISQSNNCYLVNNKIIKTPANCTFVKFYLTKQYGTTYNNDICINISHSGYRNGEYEAHWDSTASLPITTATGKLNGTGSSVVVFSDGMKSAGSVRDEAWNEYVDGVLTGKARKRLGIVDLGSLDWSYASFSGGYRFNTPKPSDIGTIGYNVSPNAICGKYTSVGSSSLDSGLDKALAITSNIYITDSSYSDATAFKTAMSGVYLIYELATPQEYTMDSAWVQGYRVDDFGTEQIVPAQSTTPTSAPLYLEVEYALNAKDAIRNLPKNYVSCTDTDNTLARIESALASAYGITMSHTWDSTNSRYTIAMSGGWQPTSSAPASASATGTKGQYYIDTDYLYVCVGSNTWKRIALTTW